MTDSTNHALKRRVFAYTLGTHPGGRGCACALAFFLYYLHPLHNFFCNIAPKVGRCLRMVMMWGHAHQLPCSTPPYPPCKACMYLYGGCSLERGGAWLLCDYQAGDELTRENQETPSQYLEEKVIYLLAYRFYILHG